MNLPDGLKMISMAEFAAYYDRSQETRATIEELKLASGYLSTDKRNEQYRNIPLHPYLIFKFFLAGVIFFSDVTQNIGNLLCNLSQFTRFLV